MPYPGVGAFHSSRQNIYLRALTRDTMVPPLPSLLLIHGGCRCIKWNSPFKAQHPLIVDEMDEGDKENFAKEQETIDNHDEEILALSLCITQLLHCCSTASE